jgi:peptidase E
LSERALPRRVVTLSTVLMPYGHNGWRIGPLLRYLLDVTGTRRPRVCVLTTATGDDPAGYLRMLGAFERTGVVASHLSLFPMPNVPDPRELLLDQDAIVVGGGSVANMVAVWRVHGLDSVFREAWERGIVLSGASAGAICWFAGGTTDSFGPDLRPFHDGLGILAGSYSPHYDSEEGRRPLFRRLVGEGSLPPGWGADDGVAMHFVDGVLCEVVAERDAVHAWRVEPSGDGSATETRIEPRVIS